MRLPPKYFSKYFGRLSYDVLDLLDFDRLAGESFQSRRPRSDSIHHSGYDTILELPLVEEDFLSYQPAGEFENLDFEGLASIIKRHLKVT